LIGNLWFHRSSLDNFFPVHHIWILKCQAPKDILSFCVLTMSSFLAVRFTLRFPGIQMYLALSTAHLLNVPLPLEIQNRCCFCLLLLFSICVSFFEFFFIINLLLDTLLSRSVCRTSLSTSRSVFYLRLSSILPSVLFNFH